ncbi:unnamed protein product [Microthlaspi erraticum]|uniref:Uncharacterized protein n=1 Tax=Microthlaspi erraticum TaxID=1685480 RepID=A0A6D2J3X2_9BRAS|nr:unnamed protein product [Microthlaspi erraticum]
MFLPPQEISRRSYSQELAVPRDASRNTRPTPRIFDWTVEVLEATNLTFSFKGPWFSGSDLLLTADPKNIHHILSTNFGNYPKGPEFKKIFDVWEMES